MVLPAASLVHSLGAIATEACSTEVERFQDLGKDTFHKMKKLIEGVTEMPGEEKKHVFQAFKQLLKISAEEMID